MIYKDPTQKRLNKQWFEFCGRPVGVVMVGGAIEAPIQRFYSDPKRVIDPQPATLLARPLAASNKDEETKLHQQRGLKIENFKYFDHS